MNSFKQFFQIVVYTLTMIGVIEIAGAADNTCQQDTPASIFENQRSPASDLTSFAAGRLGILQPSYDDFYLRIAYRVLSSGRLTPEQIDALPAHQPCPASEKIASPVTPARLPNSSSWPTANSASESDTPPANPPSANPSSNPLELFIQAQNDWHQQRQKLTGPDSAEQQAEVRRDDLQNGYAVFSNCGAEVLQMATSTLAARLNRYGKSSDLIDWLNAQQSVFANCVRPSAAPRDLPRSAPTWLQLDRAFQQALVVFYTRNHRQALELFDAISANPESPWRATAAYFAARALVNLAIAQNHNRTQLQAAQSRLNFALSQSNDGELRKLSQRLAQTLQRYLGTPTVIAQAVAPIAPTPKAAKANKSADLDPQDADSQVNLWIAALRGQDHRLDPIAQWQTNHELVWLIAALERAQSDTANLQELLDAALAVPENSPAYLSVRYQLIRLSSAAHSALQIANQLLAQEQLSAFERNRIQRSGLKRAQTLEDVVRFAQRTVAYPTLVNDVELQVPSVSDDGAQIFNQHLPLDSLIKIHRLKISDSLRNQLTLVIWTRAFVLQRWEVMRSFAPQISKMIPQDSALIDQFLAAPYVMTRQAIAAMLIARYPGMVGNISAALNPSEKLDEIAKLNPQKRWLEEGQRSNWWCAFPNEQFSNWKTVAAPELPQQTQSWRAAFLSPAEQRRFSAERLVLNTTPNATDYLGKILMQWARHQPRDPRLPQALHMIVRATSGGCIQRESEALSRAAFKHLHQYFPHNPWTKKTPVYFAAK